DDPTVRALDDYLSVHTAIRKADDGGDWDGAVKLATESGSKGANAVFATFDHRSADVLASNAASLSHDLGNSRVSLAVVRWLALILAVLAAGLSWRGLSARLAEYR